MDSPHSNFQNARMGGGGPPQFHNIMYPSKQNLFSNLFVNHPFQRTFASVVSCSNPTLNFRQSTSKLVNSFLEAIHPQPTQPPMVTNREFNDFKKMPNWRNMDCQQKYAKKGCMANNNNNNLRYRPPNKRFHYFHQHHDAATPHHHHNSNNNYNNFQKNRHEKERFSIERDIRNDRCDISNRFTSRGNQQKSSSNNNNNNNNVGNKSSATCPPTTESIKSPPFEIYSLEEFPAIVTTVTTALSSICSGGRRLSAMPQSTDKNKMSPNKEQQQQQLDVDEHDFVKFQTNIALTTPTYVQPPIRFNLCEAVTKIVTSPKKLFPLPLPKRSCLKATPLKSRSMSECSDDFIIFEKSPCMSQDTIDDEIEDDDAVEEEEEEEDDGDDSSSSDEEMEEDEEDECDNDNLKTVDYVQQPDSGIEERRVHFNAAVKVNVIRAWDYAYRAARKGSQWQEAARDRERFRNRIKCCEDVLKPIFNNDHRRKVFAERFE